GGLVDGVVGDPAVAGVGGEDAGLRAAGDEVVAHDATGAVDGGVGPVAVAQADAGVAADDDVPLDDAVAAVVPQEHRPPGLRRPPADAPRNVVADDPAS